MDLDHQPCYDPDEEYETLSLHDLPLSTTTSSSTDVTWDGSNLHQQQRDVFEFEFFNRDFNPSSSSSSDNIIFCGKLIPYRGPKPAEDDIDNKKATTKSSWKSSSLTEPRSSHGQLNRFGSSRKSRWYLLAFGVGITVPVKMELDDMKFRQSKKICYSSRSQKFQTNDEQVLVKGSKISRRKSSRGLFGILSCSRGDANSMATPFLAGAAVAAAALAGKYGIQAWQSFKARPPKMRRFYEGGFQAQMTRREAALILGLRESAAQDKVKEAHRRVMVANHPDAGGSGYLASKVNEAKDVMLGKTKGSGSAF
ncbi:Mitochondrial import inner membrane translocase subunit TIM14-1 [Linum grandiflorum]